MVNNDFIYKTMEEMKLFPRLAHLRGSIRRYYTTSSLLRSSSLFSTQDSAVFDAFLARFLNQF